MTTLQEAAMRKAILLCEWIAETPHQRGSINGQASQAEYALRTALAQQGDPVAYSQFLTDVVTAAGLLEHGRRDKGLAQRIADYAFSARSNLYTAAPAPQPADYSDKSTIAGLESSIGHLSALFNEQLLLLEEVEEKLGVDGMGNELNDGECVLIDRIREHLAAMAPPTRTAPQAQSLLASAVLALNTLWNKSSVKDSAIADQLAVCRVLAESEDDMELTDAQILTFWKETYVQRGWTGIEFARAIERAHGIGVKP